MRVATITGQPVKAVAREPYARTLWSLTMHEEHERIERAMEVSARIDMGFLFNSAMHNPDGLIAARETLERSWTTVDTQRGMRAAARARYREFHARLIAAELRGPWIRVTEPLIS